MSTRHPKQAHALAATHNKPLQRDPDPVMDPIGWRKWWMTWHPGNNWKSSSVAWNARVC